MLKVWRSLFGAAVLGISSAALSHAQHGRSPQMQADDANAGGNFLGRILQTRSHVLAA
jgi:hypothetical protein